MGVVLLHIHRARLGWGPGVSRWEREVQEAGGLDELERGQDGLLAELQAVGQVEVQAKTIEHTDILASWASMAQSLAWRLTTRRAGRVTLAVSDPDPL